MPDHKQYQVLADSVVMSSTPDIEAEATSELLFGEVLTVIEEDEEWVKGRSETDGYEGYVPRVALDDEITTPTHKITALRTFAFSEPDFKSPPIRCLSFQSRLSVLLDDDDFALLEQGGWVYINHIKDIEDISSDPVDSALKFVETPYLWGGRTSLGLDCSALVQLALLDSGYKPPRDTKDQVKSIGEDIQFDETQGYSSLQRGDLVFFKGHIGIMVNESQLLNATSRHMKTCIEPIESVSKSYGGIVSVRRLNA